MSGNDARQPTNMLIERFDALQQALVVALGRHYGSRLVSVVVFGSVGRGVPHQHSDLDVLVIARNLPAGRFKRSAEFDAVEQALEPTIDALRADGIETRLSPVLKTPEEAAAGSPLFLDFLDDARVLVDEGQVFQRQMDRLRDRLRELGARRVRIGSAWYWDLKPDFRPGEVFEL